jgi:hypothetical protein
LCGVRSNYKSNFLSDGITVEFKKTVVTIESKHRTSFGFITVLMSTFIKMTAVRNVDSLTVQLALRFVIQNWITK